YFDKDARMKCYLHWKNHHGYIPRVDAVKMYREDDSFKECWNNGVKTEADGSISLTFGEGEVTSNKRFRVACRMSFPPLKLGEFKGKFGISPHALKVKPTSVTDLDGKARSVYLVRNPARPDAEMDIERVEEVTKKDNAWKTRAVFENEAGMFYDSETERVRDDSAHGFAKALTEEEIRKRAARVPQPQPDGGAAADDSDDGSSDSGNSDASGGSGDSGRPGEPGGGGSPELASNARHFLSELSVDSKATATAPFAGLTTPAKGAKSEVVSALGGGSRSGRTQSFQRGPSSADGGAGDDLDDGPPARNAKERMAKLSIWAILDHKKKGTHMRNAREFLHKEPDAPDGDMLQEKIELAAKCTQFHRGGVFEVSLNDYNKTCEDLLNSGEEIPAVAKQYILDRRVKIWQEDPDSYNNIKDIMDIVFTWDRAMANDKSSEKERGGMGPFACTYDPTNPKVRALDISDAEKALKFGETVVKVILAPMLKIGILTDLLNMPDDGVEETLANVVTELLTCFRGAVDGGGSHDDFSDLATPPKQYTLAQSLAATTRSQPHWNGQKANYLKYRKLRERAEPRLQEVKTALAPGATAVPLDTFKTYMESIYMLKGELPEEAFDGIMGPMRDCAMHNLASIHEKLSSADGPLDDLRKYGTFLVVAVNLFPSDDEFKHAMEDVRDRKAGAANGTLLKDLKAACEAAEATTSFEAQRAGVDSATLTMVDGIVASLCGPDGFADAACTKSLVTNLHLLKPWVPASTHSMKGVSVSSFLEVFGEALGLAERRHATGMKHGSSVEDLAKKIPLEEVKEMIALVGPFNTKLDALDVHLTQKRLNHNKIRIEDLSGDAEVLTSWAGGCDGKTWSDKLRPDDKNGLAATKACYDKTLGNIPAKTLVDLAAQGEEKWSQLKERKTILEVGRSQTGFPPDQFVIDAFNVVQGALTTIFEREVIGAVDALKGNLVQMKTAIGGYKKKASTYDLWDDKPFQIWAKAVPAVLEIEKKAM
ncbi:unnamed protein product, partial [Prorocentrum cordatum]